MTDFQELGINQNIIQAIEKLGYQQPTPIQEATIPHILQGKDVLGQAQTGTGKTAAFGLPLIQRLHSHQRTPRGLILLPTRELALQVAHDLKNYARFTDIRVVTIYGGGSMFDQGRALRQGIDIVAGTPGRIIDHIGRGSLDLSKIETVILDEADRMLDMGFIDDIQYILNELPAHRQTGLFSATLPNEVLRLANRYTHEPVKALISKDEIALDNIEQICFVVERDQKIRALQRILDTENISRAIIFCATKVFTQRLAERLHRSGYSVEALTGDMSQNQRIRALEAFKRGQIELLVATDVASRGLDINDVGHIINFDLPHDPLSYFHRIGRTARMGKAGVAITLLTRSEMGELNRIKALTNTKLRVTQLAPSV